MITYNGAEFGSRAQANNKASHPFERMLSELGIKHRYTRPYRPQTNRKVERLWRTLQADLIEDMVFRFCRALQRRITAICPLL